MSKYRLQTPITEEDFVDFLIQHNIETVEELNDFSEMYLLMISEANEPCATYYTIEETVHQERPFQALIKPLKTHGYFGLKLVANT